MKRWSMLSLCVLLICCLLLAGCEAKTLDIPTTPPETHAFGEETTVSFSREYYAEDTPMDYLVRLYWIFASLYDSCEEPLTQFDEYAAEEPFVPVDQLQPTDSKCHMSHSEMPVFYGLLEETARYLADHGANTDALAAPYGKAHALRAADVQAMASTLLGKEIRLSFSNVAGAEYIESEGLFVYDELDNPMQAFLDRGWTLEIAGSVSNGTTQDWGEGASAFTQANILVLFWYDSDTATVYDFSGELIAHTHAIELLRSDQCGIQALEWCGIHPRSKENQYERRGVVIKFTGETVLTLDTPIEFVRCGTIGGCSLPYMVAWNQTDQGAALTEQIHSLETEFFDDFYRDPNAGGKITNYFLANFYERPEDVDITVLPTTDLAELAYLCDTYLGISMDQLSAEPATVGTSACETSYAAFTEAYLEDRSKIAAEPGDVIFLSYYNEIQRRPAILTLCRTEDGYQFVSNLPDPSWED